MLNRCCTTSLALLVLMTAALTWSCNEPRKVMLTKNQQKQIEQALSEKAPVASRQANVVLDGKLRLIGVDLSSDSVKAGMPFKITYHWEILKPLGGADWKIFVHLDGRKRMGFDHHGVGGLYPVNQWKAGKFLTYTQTIKLPQDAQTALARIYVGVFDEGAWKYRKQNVRMRVSNTGKTKVATTPDSRIEVARINIVGKKGKPAAKGKKADLSLPRYAIYRTPTPPVIDGKLDEPAWKKARPTRTFRDPNGKPLTPRERTRARMLWDATHIYVGFTVEDRDIFNDFTGRDATLWKKDAVEVYLDPKQDGKDYVEIQVSPTGEIFDAHFTSRRRPRWQTAAAALTIAGMKAKIHALGSINKRGDGVQDRRWSVEIAIPWAELPGVTGPPKNGEAWGMNLYRINVAGPGSRPFLAAWSPAGGDFHNTNRFATVRFSSREVSQRGKSRRPPTRPGQPKLGVKRAPVGTVKVPIVPRVTTPKGPLRPKVKGPASPKTPVVRRPVRVAPAGKAAVKATPKTPRVKATTTPKRPAVKAPAAPKKPAVKAPATPKTPAKAKPATK